MKVLSCSQGLYENVHNYLCNFARAFSGAQVRSEIHRLGVGHVKVFPQTWFRDLFLHSGFVWWEHCRVTLDMTTHTGNFISVSWTHITRVQNEICSGSVNSNANHLVPEFLRAFCNFPVIVREGKFLPCKWNPQCSLGLQENKQTGYGTIRHVNISPSFEIYKKDELDSRKHALTQLLLQWTLQTSWCRQNTNVNFPNGLIQHSD